MATTGRGISRAECDSGGNWSVAGITFRPRVLGDQGVSHSDVLADSYPPTPLGVNCLAADPHDPSSIYAGTQGQGVWHSQDRGRQWQPAGLPGQVVKSLAVSPHAPGTIYAGTKPAYLFVSRDAGQTWQELEGFRRIPFRWWWFTPAERPNQAYVQAIALSPTDPNVLLAGIEFGAVVRSDDGGKTWSRHLKNSLRDCHSLKFHASNGDWAYEAGGTGGGASYSRDGGRTWHKMKGGLAKHYGVACAADPEKPDIWYVSVAPGPGKAYGATAEAYLYRASGEVWQPIGWDAHPMSQMPIDLNSDPAAPGHLYAGTTGGTVWHSADYGDTWRKLPIDLGGIWRSFLVLSGGG